MSLRKTQNSRRPGGAQALLQARRHRINAARAAVEEQIDFFKKQFGQVKSEWKADDTRVTFADFAISEKIFAALRRHFPGDDFCSEESNPHDEVMRLKAEYAWVLDPIDGTNNYAAGMPIAAISLALLQGGVPIYGVIYDSNRDVLLHGGPEFGLYQNNARYRPQFRVDDPRAPKGDLTIGMHFPMRPEQIELVRPLLETYRVRAIGSAALSTLYAATGFFDGALDFRVRVWDIAAAYAISRAAGREFHFIGASAFPLTEFHPELPHCPFYAGSREFCNLVGGLALPGVVG